MTEFIFMPSELVARLEVMAKAEAFSIADEMWSEAAIIYPEYREKLRQLLEVKDRENPNIIGWNTHNIRNYKPRDGDEFRRHVSGKPSNRR